MIKILIPDRQHPSLNVWTRMHWAKKSKLKKSWESEIILKSGKYGQPMLENAQVEVIYYFDNRNRRDKDNYVPKFILDGLVKGGIIKDDNDSNIFLNWKLKYDKENPRTEIIVKEVS